MKSPIVSIKVLGIDNHISWGIVWYFEAAKAVVPQRHVDNTINILGREAVKVGYSYCGQGGDSEGWKEKWWQWYGYSSRANFLINKFHHQNEKNCMQ